MTALTLRTHGRVAVLTLDLPGEPVNKLNAQVKQEFEAALEQVRGDAAVQALVITSGKPDSFIAGADIEEFTRLAGQEAFTRLSREGQAMLQRLDDFPKPVVCAINGACLGGGLELALACDMRVAGDNAMLGLPEVGLGIIPGYGGTQRLTRLVGSGLALELICTGRKIDARHAHFIGLVNHCVPGVQLLDSCRSIAKEILQVAPLAVAAAKRCVHRGLDQGFGAGCQAEAQEFGKLCSTADVAEGMGAFLEKRIPAFKGE